jgi:iron complex transport system permease protein
MGRTCGAAYSAGASRPRFREALTCGCAARRYIFAVIDTLARSVTAIEIPLGILTALVGTPFFIWLLASVSKTWS